MKFAPIIIPTLNRYYHLKYCIESLQRNKWAQYTELYISLDYPKSKIHEEGYESIKNYLRQGIEGFQDIHIYYQSKNVGAYNNYIFLIEKAYEKFDRFIFTEDDNIFAPNFIEFIDRGLKIFEEDNSIIAITSSNAPGSELNKANGNILKSRNFDAYGFGTWKKKQCVYANFICRKYFEEKAFEIKNLLRLCESDMSVFFAFVSALLGSEKVYVDDKGEITCIDMTLKIFMIFEDKFVIHPVSKMSTNIGYDGSGINCPSNVVSGPYVPLDTNDEFNYEIPNEIYFTKVLNNVSMELLIRVVHGFFKVIFWKLKVIMTKKKHK